VNEHGDVFFYIMPSNRRPQRAASNRRTRTKVLENNDELLVHTVWSGLPASLLWGLPWRDDTWI